MNKLVKTAYFLIFTNKNYLFYIALSIYSYFLSNIYIWSKLNEQNIETNSEYSKLFSDSLLSNFSFIWGVVYIYLYFTEIKKGFVPRFILNDYTRRDILKLNGLKIIIIVFIVNIITIFVFFLVQYQQFNQIIFGVDKYSMLIIIQFIFIQTYCLILAYFLCLTSKNMIVSIIILLFATKIDIALYYFGQSFTQIHKYNFLPITSVKQISYYSSTNHISVISYFIIISLLIYFIFKKQSSINY